MPDEPLHTIVPRPTQVEADEYALFREIRRARKELTGSRVVFFTIEVTPKQIILIESKIVEPVVLGL